MSDRTLETAREILEGRGTAKEMTQAQEMKVHDGCVQSTSRNERHA